MEYLIIYDVRYFTVHIFNGSENTIFISLTCDIFYFYISILMFWSKFLPINELKITSYNGTVMHNRKAPLSQL